uniref:glycosyltransferase WbsX family protein n=1 Tax=Phocaeicola dorei TaxID=357276 RepID=UPI00402769ED
MKPRIIAFYLPQYHPIPENDEWWGKGFTEWTTVTKAKPLFKGHLQPRIPADLGYYDLRLSIIREQQANLAREAGIEGFCYWHYWFGNGKRLLEMPFNEVLASGKPDFPFCLGWANESWQAKVWNASSEHEHRMLIEQKYLGEQDYIDHFNCIKSAIEDKRYMRQNGCPIFLIYMPFKFKAIQDFIQLWNQLIKESGIAEKFYFIANVSDMGEYKKAISVGFDAVTFQPMARIKKIHNDRSCVMKFYIRCLQHFIKRPLFTFSYNSIKKNLVIPEIDIQEDVIPFILPNWDHSPRSGRYGVVLTGANPKSFKSHILDVLSIVRRKRNKVIFLKSWNEWGEGNFMEPDLVYGKGFIEALGKSLNKEENLENHD